MAKQEQVLQRLPDVPDNAFQPSQVLREEPPARIAKHETTDWVACEIERDTQDRVPAKLLPHGARQARQILQAAPISAIPAETLAGSLKLIPAHAGIRLIEQEAVAAIHGEIFWRKARSVSGPESPNENALKVGIANRQDRLVTVKGLNEFAQD
jgi:hypothetical protein